jgi:hypothetical protein
MHGLERELIRMLDAAERVAFPPRITIERLGQGWAVSLAGMVERHLDLPTAIHLLTEKVRLTDTLTGDGSLQ